LATTYLPTSAVPAAKVGRTFCGFYVGRIKTSCDSEYAQRYLLAQQLPQRHLAKLQFSPVSRIETEADWQGYLQRLGITSQQAVKLLTEAALLGSAIEHALSPELIIRA
jgi:hypothetical protein